MSTSCYAFIIMIEWCCQVFDSHEEADAAELTYYASLSPEQRLDLLLDIVAQQREAMGEAAENFERVYRVVELLCR